MCVASFRCLRKNKPGVSGCGIVSASKQTQADIEKAIQVLQKWNPQWKPSYFMTDKCEAEIKVIEKAFIGLLFR